MKHLIKTFAICLLLATATTLFAQKKTFICEHTYPAGDNDNKNTSRTIATVEMRNKLLWEVGTYIRTEQILVTTGSSQEYAEKTEAITAGIVEMKILDEKWNGETYCIKAEMTIDPNEVEQKIKEIVDFKLKVKELEESRARTKAAEEEAARLRNEMAQLRQQMENKNEQQRKEYEQKLAEKENNYNKQIDNLSAEEYLTKGNNAKNNKNYEQAIEYYKQAININPNFAIAYSELGDAYFNMKNYDQAIAFCNKAISIDPNLFEPYFTLGGVYSIFNLNDIERAMNYFVKAGKVSKDDNAEIFCFEFGIALLTYECKIVSTLCDLGEENFRDCNKVISTFKQIIKIAPNNVDAYNSIAYEYKKINDYEQAIAYLKQAISIAPDYATGYDSLGEMYYDIKDNETSIEYYKKAARLGYKNSQDYLRNKGISW